jgi:hypothetical protein
MKRRDPVSLAMVPWDGHTEDIIRHLAERDQLAKVVDFSRGDESDNAVVELRIRFTRMKARAPIETAG